MLTLKDKIRKRIWPTLAVILALGGVACGGSDQTATDTEPTTNGEDTEQAAVDGDATEEFDVRLSGAGASFPAPLYQRWFSAINEEYPGLEVSYQSVSSGAGVEQYLSGTVDFGASDAPLTDEEREEFADEYGSDPLQFPMVGGSVVFAYNLEGVDNLELPREAYCGIVTGDITSWNDPILTEANPDIDLPDQEINWVHRSDGSGTTFIFTNHIDSACPDWEAGAAKSVDWPAGTGGNGNEGVTAQVDQTDGAIGYVEYAYANENDIPMAALENASGNLIEPTPEAAARVFEGAEIPEDFALLVPDPEGEEAYPIAGLTWLLVYPEYDDPEVADAIEQVISWSLENGDDAAIELGYVPLAEDVAEEVIATMDEEVDTAQASD